MSLLLSQQPTPTPPAGDNNSFKRKLINFIIAALMILLEVAKHYKWLDGVDAIEVVKWIFELLSLLL